MRPHAFSGIINRIMEWKGFRIDQKGGYMKSRIKFIAIACVPVILSILVLNNCTIGPKGGSGSGSTASAMGTPKIPMGGGGSGGALSPTFQSALSDAIVFYDANKDGNNVTANNVFSWRGSSHTADFITGGFLDAGDNVKFGLPESYSAFMLAWQYYEFSGSYSTGLQAKLLDTLKYFCDYLTNCYRPPYFYFQTGSGNADHNNYWGPPEQQFPGNTYESGVTASLAGRNPPYYTYTNGGTMAASDILAQSAAALAMEALVCGSPAYSNTIISVATALYGWAKAKQGVAPYEGSFYAHSSYLDDLALAAVVLYMNTGDSTKLSDIQGYIPSGSGSLQDNWGLCWGDVYPAVFVLMSRINPNSYFTSAATYNLSNWVVLNGGQPAGSYLKMLTPYSGATYGLEFQTAASGWGDNRYATTEAFLAEVYTKQTNWPSLMIFASNQVNYVLGQNPQNFSYVVGFTGYVSSYPQHPHHGGAGGTDWSYLNSDLIAKNLLLGGMVGGMDNNGTYADTANDSQHNEVAIDYNSGLVGSIAGLTATTSAVTPSKTWQVVGSADFSPNQASGMSLIIYNGQPYVAFSDGNLGSFNPVMVMTYTGGAWQTVGSGDATPGVTAYINLGQYNGQLYLSFMDNTAYNLDGLINTGGSSVMTYTGGSWQYVGPAGFSKAPGYFQSLAFGSTGQLYSAFEDYAPDLNWYGSVMTYTGGTWQNVGNANFTPSSASFVTMIVYNDQPYICFSDLSTSPTGARASVMTYTGGMWQYVGTAGFSPGWAMEPCMAVSSTGQLYVAFDDEQNGGKLTVMTYSGGTWQYVGAGPGITASAIVKPCIAVYNDQVYVAYLDNASSGGVNSGITVITYTGGTWQNVGSADFSPPTLGSLSFAIDPANGQLYVAYSDTAYVYKACVMTYK